MAIFRRGDVWWYEFWFAGRCIRESGKSPSKTLANAAEQSRVCIQRARSNRCCAR